MGSKRDDRDEQERKEWDKGKFTKAEAKDMGMSQAEANKFREQEERRAGNPLAPPE